MLLFMPMPMPLVALVVLLPILGGGGILNVPVFAGFIGGGAMLNEEYGLPWAEGCASAGVIEGKLDSEDVFVDGVDEVLAQAFEEELAALLQSMPELCGVMVVVLGVIVLPMLMAGLDCCWGGL